MTHYIDIRVLPDPEFSAPVLMNALFAKLHRALFDLQNRCIGISFPEHGRSLGHLLRLHGPASKLLELMELQWLKGLRDYTECTGIETTPEDVRYQSVRRVQAKSNPERLRRRAIKRHGLTEQEALDRIPDTAAEMLKLPYLQMKSVSTGRGFRLFIHHSEAQEQEVEGEFNAYGLSTTATIPLF